MIRFPRRYYFIALVTCCCALIAAPRLAAFIPTEDGLYAVFETNRGEFTAKLYFEDVPQTVANFVGLAEGSRPFLNATTGAVEQRPYYDGIIFHRVIKGFMIQGGSPNGQGTDGPGYTILDEIDRDHFHTRSGLLSMAKTSAPNSGGSQFFVTLAPTAWLDGNHAVFGEIVEGMNVVTTIGSTETDASDRPTSEVVINHLRIIRQGAAAQAFDVNGHQVPVVQSMAEQWQQSPTPGTLSFEADGASLYQLFTSSNLTNWSLNGTVSIGQTGARSWNLAARAVGGTALFANTSAITFPQGESHAGETLTRVPQLWGLDWDSGAGLRVIRARFSPLHFAQAWSPGAIGGRDEPATVRCPGRVWRRCAGADPGCVRPV